MKNCLGLHGRGFDSRGGRFSHGTHAWRDRLYYYTALLTNCWKLNTERLVGANTFSCFFLFFVTFIFQPPPSPPPSRTHGATRVTKSLTNPVLLGVGQIGHLKQKSGHQLRCSAFSSACTLLAYYPDNGTTGRLDRKNHIFASKFEALAYSTVTYKLAHFAVLFTFLGPTTSGWMELLLDGKKHTGNCGLG